MNDRNVEEVLRKLPGCNEKMAVSILRQCQLAGIEGIEDVVVQSDDIYTVLKLSTDEQVDYYVFLGDGYFLEQIRKESKEGQRIYRAIE